MPVQLHMQKTAKQSFATCERSLSHTASCLVRHHPGLEPLVAVLSVHPEPDLHIVAVSFTARGLCMVQDHE